MDDKSRSRMMRITVVVLSLVITGIILVLVLSLISAQTNYTYKIDENGITITAGRGINIPYTKISSIKYMDKAPALSDRFGTSLGNIKSGTFTVEGIGRGNVYATDITKPVLIIYTSDTFYLITPDNIKDVEDKVLDKVKNNAQ